MPTLCNDRNSIADANKPSDVDSQDNVILNSGHYNKKKVSTNTREGKPTAPLCNDRNTLPPNPQRSKRVVKPVTRYPRKENASIAEIEPKTYDKALNSLLHNQWKQAMQVEVEVLIKNKT
jgi:hypothetical protein